jgi:hypothetical protein
MKQTLFILDTCMLFKFLKDVLILELCTLFDTATFNHDHETNILNFI